MASQLPELKQATIYDVAAAAGVSKSLVSLVLRGEDKVGSARKAAVLKAIEELGYVPSRSARNLAGGRTRTIGIIITDYTNLSYVGFLRGLREVFDQAGFQAIVSDLHGSPNMSEDSVDAFIAMRVEGLIVAAEIPKLNDQIIDVPLVTIGDRENVPKNSDRVFNDDSAGVRLILNHLHALGHRKIIHISGFGGISTKRMTAYEAIMKELGLVPEVHGKGIVTTEMGGYLMTKEILAAKRKFTAIFTANDAQAAGAITALQESGLRVPEDVSVVGYDNAPIASEFLMRITTVDDMGLPVGHEAAKLLLDRITDRKRTPGKKIVIPPMLHERATTAKVKG